MSATQSIQASLSSFQWPWQYEFPPFFTLQTNSDTRTKQIDAWCDLVLDFYRHSKVYSMEVQEALSSPLFCNTKINIIQLGRLSIETIYVVLEALACKGNVEWEDSSKTRCLVMWRSPEEWGKMIFQWASEQGLGASVCTLYEIHSGEYSTDTEFYNMEPWMLKKAILALSREGKAEYIPGSAPDDSDAGVKFLS